MEESVKELRQARLFTNKKTIDVLRKILSIEGKDCTDVTQMFLRMWDVLDYLNGNKTQSFNNEIEKKYINRLGDKNNE